jgi:hypothetical protein
LREHGISMFDLELIFDMVDFYENSGDADRLEVIFDYRMADKILVDASQNFKRLKREIDKYRT